MCYSIASSLVRAPHFKKAPQEMQGTARAYSKSHDQGISDRRPMTEGLVTESRYRNCDSPGPE